MNYNEPALLTVMLIIHRILIIAQGVDLYVLLTINTIQRILLIPP